MESKQHQVVVIHTISEIPALRIDTFLFHSLLNAAPHHFTLLCLASMYSFCEYTNSVSSKIMQIKVALGVASIGSQSVIILYILYINRSTLMSRSSQFTVKIGNNLPHVSCKLQQISIQSLSEVEFTGYDNSPLLLLCYNHGLLCGNGNIPPRLLPYVYPTAPIEWHTIIWNLELKYGIREQKSGEWGK